MLQSTVKDVLSSKGSSEVLSIAPEATVLLAIKMMSEHNVGALLVIDDVEQIVGIVTERDYARKVYLEERSSATTAVYEIMTPNVLCVGPEQTAENCMVLMTEKRLRHLPVVEDDSLIGLISMGDIVKALLIDKDMLIDQLTTYITGANTPHHGFLFKRRAA